MRKHNRLISMLLVVALTLSLSLSAGAVSFTSEDDTFTVEKISHPDNPLGTADGIVDYVGNGVVSASDQGQGDRGQNYAWSAVGYGDYMYVGTCYNAMGSTLTFMDSVLGHDFDSETMQATLNVLFNGHFYTSEPDGGNPGGVLLKVNVKTSEVTVLMSRGTTGDSPLFRNACEYQDKLYFCGSVNGLPMIYQVDPATDEVKPVYQGMTAAEYYECYQKGICTGIRGLCEFNGQLIVSCVTMDGPQILISTEPWNGQEAFTQIADQDDLFNYPAYLFTDSIYGGSIWEMVEFNDSLYVSICTGTRDNMLDENTMQSFALVRGDQAEDGSWTWTSVIGDQENDGAKFTFGIDPERTRAGAGVLTVYGDYLYIGEYNDEQIAIENILFNLDCTYMNLNLEQSVSLYRMDKDENIELVMGDATSMFPEGSLSGLESGFGRRENQYIWRMNVYDGKLYVGTFDTSSLLHCITQFVNGDLASMSQEEWMQLLGFIRTLLELQNSGSEASTQSMDNLEKLLNSKSDTQIAQIMRASSSDVSMMSVSEYTESMDQLYAIAAGVVEVAMRTRTATRGFDLYVSEDGVNFETLTIDGFGDPYNHGLRVYANTDAGMCIGTANPFYGTQLWLMAAEEEDVEEPTDPEQPDTGCDGGENCPSARFTDVNPDAWYHLSVDYCVENGIMNGMSDTYFGVDNNTNRAQLVTMLWRLSGEPEATEEAPFTDLTPGAYYEAAVNWAYTNGIVLGTTTQTFSPDMNLSREQLATILYRYTNSYLGLDVSAAADLSAYPDSNKISAYASDAVSWAVAVGLIQGFPQGDDLLLAPYGLATRAQITAIFQRYCENVLTAE